MFAGRCDCWGGDEGGGGGGTRSALSCTCNGHTRAPAGGCARAGGRNTSLRTRNVAVPPSRLSRDNSQEEPPSPVSPSPQAAAEEQDEEDRDQREAAADQQPAGKVRKGHGRRRQFKSEPSESRPPPQDAPPAEPLSDEGNLYSSEEDDGAEEPAKDVSAHNPAIDEEALLAELQKNRPASGTVGALVSIGDMVGLEDEGSAESDADDEAEQEKQRFIEAMRAACHEPADTAPPGFILFFIIFFLFEKGEKGWKMREKRKHGVGSVKINEKNERITFRARKINSDGTA